MFACCGAAFFLAPALALAEAGEAKGLEILTVQLWPEYDRHAMLVMLEGKLRRETSFPAEVTVRIPRGVGRPSAVAKRGKDGKLYTIKYARKVDGAWATIAMKTDRPVFQVEYYAPLKIEGALRRFHFEWPKAPAIEKVRWSVQAPLGGRLLKTSPVSTKLWRDPRNLVYHRRERCGHRGGEALRLDVSYEKSDVVLTTTMLKRQPKRARQIAGGSPPVVPAMTSGAGGGQGGGEVPDEKSDFQRWVFGLLLLAGAVGTVLALGRSRRQGRDG
ncbi:MAG: hypothetical protein KAI47_13380 [Deltaproteobacteria bacterium]|nr:hypothetical protein [Deltaproteobacteria bacterium]